MLRYEIFEGLTADGGANWFEIVAHAIQIRLTHQLRLPKTVQSHFNTKITLK